MDKGAANVSLPYAADSAITHWAERALAGSISDSTAAAYERRLAAFLGYLNALDVTSTGALSASLLAAWVDAPISAVSPGSRGRAGESASASTRRNRQVLLRSVLSIWAARGWVDSALIPSRVIATKRGSTAYPLSPVEAERIRKAGQQSPSDTLLPALVALGLAGVNHTEIAGLTIGSFDATDGSLRVVGRRRRTTRVIDLDSHASRVLEVHLAALTRVARRGRTILGPAGMPLALPTAPRTHRGQVTPTAVGQHLYRALRIAGITRSGVTPGSLVDYAANCQYAQTSRVEDVAVLLGLVSLDAAMRYVDHDWQSHYAAYVREQRT